MKIMGGSKPGPEDQADGPEINLQLGTVEGSWSGQTAALTTFKVQARKWPEKRQRTVVSKVTWLNG